MHSRTPLRFRSARDLLFVRCPRRVRRALRWHLQQGHGVALSALAAVAGALLAPAAALANPSGAQVVAGQVQIHGSVPATLDIHQGSQRAIINWQSFSIGAGETVNFVQPSLNSVALNRVLGKDPSAIFGRLNATGTVMLVNPNGVVFGAGSRVDVGGLVATTSNIDDRDFMAGRFNFGQPSPLAHAGIVNAGHISIKETGLAALVAPSVQNSGVIEARLGRIALAGAERFTLDFQGDGLLSFNAGSAVSAAQAASVGNTGTLRADGGTVLLTAGAVQGVIDNVINTSGVIAATSVGSHGGRIVLAGGSEGSVAVSGSLDASGTQAGQHGGSVTVTGAAVSVAAGANIDVSGPAGGGEIALGSQGRASGFAGKSHRTTVAAGASLRADALLQGDGGSITAWSKDTTVFAGSLSARGGAAGGNGGFAEVSSQKNIGLTGSVDLRAPKGATGQLLLDPTDLRITDSNAGGSQDGNAGNGNVLAGDADAGTGSTLNTVSRGLLESLSGSSNITLQATGQITIDAMAGGLINLATTAGHGVSLQSTQSGGIRFVDAATELRTQGGSITFEAFGIGSTLSNIGKLNSNGGAITLSATGNVQLAGAVNAGAGAVTVQSTVGSIANAAGAAPLLGGASVSLSAPGGNVGAAGSTISTQTTHLAISSGGHVFAASNTPLASLALSAAHVAPNGGNTYAVSAPSLDFQVADGAALGVNHIGQAGLNLDLRSDVSVQLGTLNLGSGTLALASTAGNLLGGAGSALTASAITLAASGSNGNNGAVGAVGQAVNTATSHLSATAGSGGAFVANSGVLSLDRLSTTGTSSISSSGTLTAGDVNAGSATLALASGGGSIADDNNAATEITAGTLQLGAGGAIGSSISRLQTTAATVSADAASGGIYAHSSATSSTFATVTSGNGAIDLTAGGSTTLGTLTSSSSAPANSISVATTAAGSISVGTVNAGSLGNVTLGTLNGGISGSSGLITGDTVSLTTGTSGSIAVRTAASNLNAQAASGNINLTQAGAVTLGNIVTPGSTVTVTSSSGDITVGTVRTASSGQVSLTASAGAIREDGNSATRISTGTATLSAGASIGAAGQAVQTSASGLSATSTGNLYVNNADATLSSLSVNNRHSAPGTVNTLEVNSPYLTFDVTDNGASYALNRLVGVPLNALSFTGDQGAVIGQVQAAGAVSLAATAGNLLDDGNGRTRTTAGSTLTLSAAQGSVGSAAQPIGVNAASVVLTTRGDLYVAGIADLNTLTIASAHPDSTTSFGIAVTAPSLKFAVTDSAAGHHVQTLTDNSSLTLNFTSDRSITLGSVNASYSGSVRFTSNGGSILDDGDKSTRVLANSATFAGAAVGTSGAGHLDVVTGTLAATASAGGVYVEVPMPTGSSNTTGTLTLGTVTATGPVAITALEGDLSLGGFVTATNQAVSLTATLGSIFSPSGYSIGVGSGSVLLTAGQAIGTSVRAVPLTSTAGATLGAQARTTMFLSGSGPMNLASLSAATGIAYTQSSGAVTVGSVNLTAGGSVAITAATGSLLDDGNNTTGITASEVTLSAAQGSVGSGSAAIGVATPRLAITAHGAVAVAGSAALESLSLTRGSGSAGSIGITAGGGQSFAITEDSASHYLQGVSSATPLAFSFSGQRGVKVGNVSVGAAGSASIASAADVVADGVPGSAITAGTVSLTAGSAGSIGAAGNAIALQGTTALSLSAGRNFFVGSDAALASLTLASTNTTTAAGTASVFGVTALGQSFGITDSGSTQTLAFSGTALGSASFTTRKNIEVGAITASGDVTLATAGGGANSNITSDSGTGTIAGNRVLLSATSSTAGGGSIGSSGTALRVDTPTVIVAGSGNVYVNDAQNLAKLDMTLTHGTNTTFGYDVTAGNLNSFSVTDGSTQSLGLAVSGWMDFSYSVDRALSLATVDAGTSSTGSIALTSRSAPTGTGAQINRSSGTLTGGSISLSATGTNGGVGAGATLSTNTQNLAIASGGNVSVSNATTLTSFSLDAQHRTSGSSTHSYSISSTGLTFSISDTLGNNAFQLANIAQSGLDLSVKADRVLTASSINTGAGGKVTLNSSSYVQGGSGANAGSPSISTGDLTLNGGSAFGYQGSTPLYTAAGTLASTLSSTLYLSNSGSLTLNASTVGSSADVASSNASLLQGTGRFATPTLKLTANQSLGASSGGELLTDARRLTLVSGKDVFTSNATDLFALSLTSNHATPGVQNTISVAAPRLALALTDSVGGNQLHLSSLVDSSGLDFTLSTDVALALGSVNAQAGRLLSLASTGSATSITNDGASLLTAGAVTLSAGGSVGAAGGSATRMQTDALGLSLTTGANAYADNAQDLSSLSLTSTQNSGGSAPVYQVTAPQLAFDITDDGVTHINGVTDGTGLNFALNTRRAQTVGNIDVQRSGTVALTSAGDITGDADSSRRISAASATLTASGGSAIGTLASPIRLSAPLATFNPTGALNVESDTHIDRLTINTTHPTATYGGAYSIVSTPFTGAAYALFTATDDASGTALTSLDDPLGLAFSFTSDRAIQVGSLDLGSTGTAALTSSGNIRGDGNAATQVKAASLNMVSYGGAIGAAGAGNAIDATVNSVSAAAQGGGVNLALHGRTNASSISSNGAVGFSNDVGDIALGSINAQGNGVSIDNQGGSILSGSIFNASTVSLTASGSIGNNSAIGTSANGGGTTTLSATASAAHGATGSIAINESYNLAAASITAPDTITLGAGYGLAAGTINSSGGAVTLSSSQGSITGLNGSNSITGSAVTLSARYGSGNGIGSSGTRLNVATPRLTLNTPGSVYITDSADLALLAIDRTNYSGSGSSGTLSVIASGLTFSASDSGNTTTLTTLADSTGLDFSYLGIGSLAIGSVNVGSTGTALLQASLSSGNGNIDAVNNASLITAGALTMQAMGAGSNIGSSGTALGLAVGSVTANAGTGGLALKQAGSLNLSNLSTTGDLAVTATSGDLTLGTLSYGSSKTLSLAAAAGSILAGGATLAGGSSSAAISLSAANGIGTELAPIVVNASAGHTVSASVTGSGSAWITSLGTLNGGLTTAVHDGATTVNAGGNIKLASMTSGTDAAGNDIRVTAGAGNITVGTVSGGSDARFNAVELSANAGRIVGQSGTSLQGYDVKLHGAQGVGDTTYRMAASGQRMQVTSNGGAIYLKADTPSVFSYVASGGGLIDVAATADVLVANALSGGGNITVASSTAGVDLIAGNLSAGPGSVTLTSSGAGGTVRDDGNRDTRVAGNSITVNAAAGVGSAGSALQTRAGTLTIGSANGIFVQDDNAAGVTLASVIASSGAVAIDTAGPTVATLVQAQADAAGNNVTLSSSGDLTLGSVRAGANHGAVNVSAAGSIVGSGSGPHIRAHSASLAAGADIGSVSDPATGAGAPIRLDVAALGGLSTSGIQRVVSIDYAGANTLVLGGGALSLGNGSSAYVSTAGDLDASAGINLAGGNLSLSAGGTLTLATSGIATSGAVRLVGTTDVVTAGSGAAARELHVAGSSLVLRSGAAGGDTRLVTSVGSLDARLLGAGHLSLANTGTLGSAALATADGDIDATSSGGLTAHSVVAGGSHRAVSLSAGGGDLTAGTVNAGTDGTVTLAASGALVSAASVITGSTLNLSAGQSIGSAGAAFAVQAAQVSADVTGSGGIWLASAGDVTLGRLSTADGDISVAGSGHIVSSTALVAGNGGSLSLVSTGGDITLAHAVTQAGNVTLQGGQLDVLGVASSGAQSYTGALTLGGDLAAASIAVHGPLTLAGGDRRLDTQAANGAITISGTLAGAGHAATLQAGSGYVAVTGSASNLASLAIGAGQITLGETSVAGAARFNGRLDGAQALAIGGDAVFGGDVGSTSALASLTVGGSTLLGGSMSTSGAQQYGGAVTLAADATLSGQNVAFASSIEGAHALTVNTAGSTRFGGSVRTASLATDGGGSLALDGGSIETTGALRFGECAVLGANTTLTGSSVTLAGGADAASAGGQSLAINGAATIGGALGSQQALGTLTIGGDALLAGGPVRTLGAQQYGGAVTLGADTALAATTATFAGTLDGPHALAVEGNAVFGGAVGSASGNTAALASLSVGSSTLLGGGVATSGAQQYTGAVTLTADATLNGESVAFAGSIGGAHALAINAAGSTTLGGPVKLASLATDAAGTLTLNGGSIETSGVQRFGERAVLASDTTLTGSSVTLAGGADAATAGGQRLTIDGAATIGGAIGSQAALSTLAIGGDAALGGSLVRTTGAQTYAGAVLLAADQNLQTAGGSVTFNGTVDGAQALSINTGSGDIGFNGSIGLATRVGALQLESGGATTFGATARAAALQAGRSAAETTGGVRAASVTTDAAGTLVIDTGSIDTTGTQRYGERMVIGADTTLTATTVSLLAGADGKSAGAQRLVIAGNAEIGGPLGAQQALGALSISGTATLAAGSITTAGDQQFGGAVQLVGDQALRSSAGSIGFGSAIDSSGSANLSLDSEAGAIALAGVNLAGALTVHAGTTIDFSGNVGANEIAVAGAGGLTRFLGSVQADGAGGIGLTGHSFSFAKAVTASAGALNVALTNTGGTLAFAPEAAVEAATGFIQTGGAGITLPASVLVGRGPITFEAPARLPSGDARIETDGTITMSGLEGPATNLVLAAGSGSLLIGSAGGLEGQRINVATLAVPDAASAMLFGLIGGQGGALAASRINSRLVNDPYFINTTAWGPVEAINRVVATTVPRTVVPSTPGASALFTGAVTSSGIAPNALSVYAAPQVLTVRSEEKQEERAP
jgi:filamentous hemagglutinin family protein